jgi:hypothetical protein
VMSNTARRNNAHSHQDNSTVVSFSPRTSSSTRAHKSMPA